MNILVRVNTGTAMIKGVSDSVFIGFISTELTDRFLNIKVYSCRKLSQLGYLVKYKTKKYLNQILFLFGF